MRIAVLLGLNEETGESGFIASGDPKKMKDLAKSLITENTTKWPKMRLFDQYSKRYKAGPIKSKSRGRPKKEAEVLEDA